MFEQDHPQSPTEQAQPKKRMGTAVMLAAGGVVVATLFATVASMLAIFSAAQLIAIGVLGEYMGRIHANGLGLPTYVVRPTAPVIPAPAGESVPPARSSIQTTSRV